MDRGGSPGSEPRSLRIGFASYVTRGKGLIDLVERVSAQEKRAFALAAAGPITTETETDMLTRLHRATTSSPS